MIFPFNAGEVFKIAMTIEDNGQLFYEKAAAQKLPAEIINIFKELGAEEQTHKATFAALFKQLPAEATAETVWDPDNEVDLYLKMLADQHVFNQSPEAIVQMAQNISSPQDAISLAMGFEKDTIVFFLELMSLSEAYDDSRREIQKLVDEERRHLKKLAAALNALAAK